MWSLSLLAQGGRQDNDPLRSPEVIWGTAGLALALLAGALVVWLVDRWRKRLDTGTTDATGELTEFRAMYQRGEITEEEYAKLRNRVAGRVKATATSTALPGSGNPSGPLAPAATRIDVPPTTGTNQPPPPASPETPANPPPPA